MIIYNTHKKGVLAEMADKVGVSKSYLCNILARRRIPTARVAQALHIVTGVPMEVWLFPKDYKNPFINAVKQIRKKNKRR